MELEKRSPPELPTDVLFQILLRVPAESLHRLRSVCKSWHGVIHDECFVESHLQLWRSGRGPFTWPVKQYVFGRKPRIIFFTLSIEDGREAKAHHTELLMEDCLAGALPGLRKRVHIHFCPNLRLLDSCDGLLLFSAIDRCSGSDRAYHRLLVCNPITKSRRVLPRCGPFKPHEFRWKIVSNADLRQHYVVGMETIHGMALARVIRCFIFKLHRGKGRESTAWKELCIDIPWDCRSHLEAPVVSIGRKVNWLLRLHNNNARMETALLSLDLSTERQMLTGIPSENLASRCPNWFYSETVMCCCLRIPFSLDLELWVVKDFDHPVWHKHHVITNPPEKFLPSTSWYGIYLEGEDKLIMKLYCKGFGFQYRVSSQEWRSIEFVPFDDNARRPFVPHVNSLVRCD